MNTVHLKSPARIGIAIPETNGAPSLSRESALIKNGMAPPATNGAALSGTNGTLPETDGVAAPEAVANSSGVPRELHRISEVRVQQGASLRSVARKLDLSVQEVCEQECSTTDLQISDLLQWQEILEVPLADLLIDSEGPLSEPVCERARMLRIMKTAKAIKEGAHNRSVIRLANMLIGQLVEIMPELSDVAAWHTVGQRRTQEEVGRIVERAIPDSFFTDSNG